MSIKRELASGVFYTAVAKYSRILIGLVITGVLARLLTPEDFGVVAIATVIITFFNILGDIGIGPAIIQRQNLTKSDLNQIFSLTIYLGLFLGAIFFFSAHAIGSWYDNRDLIGICQWLSLNILSSCATIVPVNLQNKAKKFKELAIITLSGQIISGVIAIIYAYLGGGVYALVFQQIIGNILLLAVYLKMSHLRFVFKVGKEAVNKILSFSVYQFLFNFINYFSRNLDKLLIGRYIGLYQLGFYEKSYRLMLLPLQNITHIITPVMLPVFSEFQNDKQQVSAKFSKILQLLSYISFPLSIALFFCARELILLVFGPQWELAVMPFKILSFSVALQILTSSSGSIYQVIDYTRGLFISGCWCAIFMVSSFLCTIFCFGTIESVCYGFLIAQVANTVQTFVLLFRKLEYPLMDFMRILINPVIIAGVLAVALYAVLPVCSGYSLMASLAVKTAVSLAVWCIGLHLLSPYNVKTFLKTHLLHKYETAN
jgi:PST family polysaccharide transporter